MKRFAFPQAAPPRNISTTTGLVCHLLNPCLQHCGDSADQWVRQYWGKPREGNSSFAAIGKHQTRMTGVGRLLAHGRGAAARGRQTKEGPRDADRNRNGGMMHAGLSLPSSFVAVCIESAALPRMCSARRDSGCLHLRFFPSIRLEPDINSGFHQAAERKDVDGCMRDGGGIKES